MRFSSSKWRVQLSHRSPQGFSPETIQNSEISERGNVKVFLKAAAILRKTDCERQEPPSKKPWNKQYLLRSHDLINFGHKLVQRSVNAQETVVLYCINKPLCRNWQTRRIQNPLVLQPCGFESHQRHHFENNKKESIMKRDELNRYEVIKSMHKIICNMNNEEAYLRWIYLVPDEATDDDFRSIASNKNLMADCEQVFCKIIEDYGKDGFYYG